MTTTDILARFGADKNGMAHCPTHDDKKRSLHISAGRNGDTVLFDHAGCKVPDILAAKGLTITDLFGEPKANGAGRVIEATYNYRDEGGELLFQAVRYNPKGFVQRRPDGNGGWDYSLKGVRRVLYHLPELLAADQAETVFLVEGEKDVDRLRAGGLVATCSPMGAGKWRDEYAVSLAGRRVVVIPDNDQAGRDHARVEARSLVGVAASVKMLALSGLPEKGDVSDWLSLGGTIETLRAMAEAAPEWKPDAEESPQAEPARISISWADLCQMEFPPRETLLHEIERGEVVMVAAITNRGKTTFMRNAAISLATGRDYLPLVKAGTPRVVYYADFETGLSRARADITKMLGKLPESDRALMATNFHLVADCRIDELPLSLSNPAHLAFVEEDARRVGADVIIVDTVTVAFDFTDENNNAECTRVMKRLIRLARQLNAVVIFLHHVGKAKQEEGQTAQNVHRARGGSALSGASTAIINLLPDPKADDVFTLECAKVKGEKFDDRLFKLNKETRWYENAGTGATGEAEPVPLYDQIVGIFNGQPLKRADVMAAFPDLSADTIDRQLKKATELGALLPGKDGKATTYRKPEKPNVPHVPTPYKAAERAERSQAVEDVVDSELFDGWPESGADDVAERSGGYGGGHHPDDYDG